MTILDIIKSLFSRKQEMKNEVKPMEAVAPRKKKKHTKVKYRLSSMRCAHKIRKPEIPNHDILCPACNPESTLSLDQWIALVNKKRSDWMKKEREIARNAGVTNRTIKHDKYNPFGTTKPATAQYLSKPFTELEAGTPKPSESLPPEITIDPPRPYPHKRMCRSCMTQLLTSTETKCPKCGDIMEPFEHCHIDFELLDGSRQHGSWCKSG